MTHFLKRSLKVFSITAPTFCSAVALASEFGQTDLAALERANVGSIEFQRPKSGSSLAQVQSLYSELVARETRIGVLPQHQSRIYLHASVTAKSALVIAGLYDTPKFVQGIAQALHREGMNVLSLRIAGHGTGRTKDLMTVRYRDWLADMNLGLKLAMLLGENVTFVGHSTGGGLAVVASCLYPTSVHDLVLIAPALDLAFGTKAAVKVSEHIQFTSDTTCPDPEEGGLGCKAMDLINPVFTSQFREKLPVVPIAGRQVGLLAAYARTVCDEDYSQIKSPVLMISTAKDDVVNHDVNDQVSRKNNWRRLMFGKDSGVGHVNLPKSSIDEFSHDPRSHNPYFDSMLGHILDFISVTN